MAIAFYVKDPPRPKSKRKERFFYSFILTLGLASIAFAIAPYLVWQFKTLPQISSPLEGAPIPEGQVLSQETTLASQVQVVKDPDGFSYFTTTYKPEGERPQEFFLSIPKLKIKNATVKTDTLNFYNNLSHFPGSALPGEIGNSFITGHSVLTEFADPKNYRSIFTKLSDLEVGDDIFVDTNDQTYHYVVQYKRVVNPQDISVLTPLSPTSRNLTLMTCVPPGTNLKRLVVITSLI